MGTLPEFKQLLNRFNCLITNSVICPYVLLWSFNEIKTLPTLHKFYPEHLILIYYSSLKIRETNPSAGKLSMSESRKIHVFCLWHFYVTSSGFRKAVCSFLKSVIPLCVHNILYYKYMNLTFDTILRRFKWFLRFLILGQSHTELVVWWLDNW